MTVKRFVMLPFYRIMSILVQSAPYWYDLTPSKLPSVDEALDYLISKGAVEMNALGEVRATMAGTRLFLDTQKKYGL
jgi:hypothetical protein